MKFLRMCECGCGTKICEIEQYKGFSLELRPYGDSDKWKQVKAVKIQKDKLDEVLLQSERFSGYQTLVDDTGHDSRPTVEKIVSDIKKTIDEFEQVRNEVIQSVSGEQT